MASDRVLRVFVAFVFVCFDLLAFASFLEFLGNTGTLLPVAEDYIITPYPSRPGTPWKLTIPQRVAGKRVRRFYATEMEAWSAGPKLLEQIRNKGVQSLNSPTGMTMDTAVRLWKADVGEKSKSHTDKVAKMAELLKAKFHGPLEFIEPVAVHRWVKTLGKTETSKATFFRYARMFFRWARLARFISENPLDGARAPRATPGRNILTPEQMKQMVNAEMPDDVRALVLLGGFAGLRTIEVARMDWEDVDLQRAQIYVRPEVSKQHDGMLERVVDFTPPLKKRAKFFKNKKGRIVTGSMEALYERRRKVALSLGWPEWPDNALRHSFATYHLAQCGNAPLTAYQMGHTSPTMVQRVYAVPSRRADWRAWWKI